MTINYFIWKMCYLQNGIKVPVICPCKFETADFILRIHGYMLIYLYTNLCLTYQRCCDAIMWTVLFLLTLSFYTFDFTSYLVLYAPYPDSRPLIGQRCSHRFHYWLLDKITKTIACSIAPFVCTMQEHTNLLEINIGCARINMHIMILLYIWFVFVNTDEM